MSDKPQSLMIPEPSIPQLLQTAVERGAPADVMEKLVNLRITVDREMAERQFNEAMNAAQGEMKQVSADAVNPQTKSKYATYHQLDRALRPIYTKHGFAISYSTTDCPTPEHIRVLAYVSRGAYTRTYQCDVSTDTKGPKGNDFMSKPHAGGSAMSYGMRYLLKMIFNVAVGEDDNDGNGEIPDWVQEYIDAMRAATTRAELKKLYDEAKEKAGKDKKILGAIIDAKDARKAKL